MNARRLSAVACTALVLLFGLSAGAARSAEPIDVTYIAPDAFLAIVAHPRQMLQYQTENAETRDWVVQRMAEETEIDLSNLEEFVIQVGTQMEPRDANFGGGPDPETAYAIVMRFAKPIDPEKLVEKLFVGSAKAEHDGKDYYKSKSVYQPSGYFPNDRTLIVANEPRLKRIMASTGTMSTLVSQLRRADASPDLIAIADVDSGREVLKMFFNEASLAEPFSPLAALEGLRMFSLTAKLNGDVPVNVEFTSDNNESAEELKKQVDTILEFGKDNFPAARKDILEDAPAPVLGKLAVQLIDTLLSGTKSEQAGRQVRVRLEAPGGVTSAVGLFAEALAMDFRRMDQYRAEPPVPRVIDGAEKPLITEPVAE